MNVDIAALRAIERDKDVSFETVLEAIETALLTAYRHTDGHQPNVRIDVDRKTGLRFKGKVVWHVEVGDAVPYGSRYAYFSDSAPARLRRSFRIT